MIIVSFIVHVCSFFCNIHWDLQRQCTWHKPFVTRTFEFVYLDRTHKGHKNTWDQHKIKNKKRTYSMCSIVKMMSFQPFWFYLNHSVTTSLHNKLYETCCAWPCRWWLIFVSTRHKTSPIRFLHKKSCNLNIQI